MLAHTAGSGNGIPLTHWLVRRLKKMERELVAASPEKGSGIEAESLGEPGKNRTCDPLIKSQLLYRLSYGLSQERRNLVFDSAGVNVGKAAVREFLDRVRNGRKT